jgi:hypothetical protein
MPRRRRRLPWVILGVVLFVLISGVLARFLNVENDERNSILGVLQAQAAGDPQRTIRLLSGCEARPSCVASVQTDTTRLRRPGDVKILLLQSRTSYSLTTATGRTRVAWTVIGRPPVVQCVLVRRSGNALTGLSVTLLDLSPPISNTGNC